ncbi:hypothetical protein EDC01DRAFT_635853 [Geopyxis carbonaria]|nr:hypothetical protein EDC01DRAFT_635853 [Geopyxis carbonaria]
MTDQNRFSPNFNIYDYVNAAELNSALGHMVLERLNEVYNELEPTTMGDVSNCIPAIVWDAVEWANRRGPPELAHQPAIQEPMMVELFRCTWADCAQVFNTRAKLRRHFDLHTVSEQKCPLCHSGGRLFKRVDKLQAHLLNQHWPFATEEVEASVNAMYKVPGSGRGWLERVRELNRQSSADPEHNAQQTGLKEDATKNP